MLIVIFKHIKQTCLQNCMFAIFTIPECFTLNTFVCYTYTIKVILKLAQITTCATVFKLCHFIFTTMLHSGQKYTSPFMWLSISIGSAEGLKFEISCLNSVCSDLELISANTKEK